MTGVLLEAAGAVQPRAAAPADAAPVLTVHDLTKHFAVSRSWPFGRRRMLKAVDGVSFAIARGSVVGLVGESGSGKSTIGRLIVRMIEPTSGRILFDGKDVATAQGAELKDLRKSLQMIFQDPFGSLNPRLTVERVVGEGLSVHGIHKGSARAERIAELLRRVGLSPEHGRRYPHEFSGGQRQRISIARALAVEPRLLIADEPVSALDVSIQAQILNLLADLKDEFGLGLLLVSHDLGVVHHLADQVIVLYLGRIMEVGPPEILYADPIHPYTRSLLEAMPVADPRTRDQRRRTLLQGDIPSPVYPPSGCVFRTRCPIATGDCAQVVPKLEPAGPGRLKACIRR